MSTRRHISFLAAAGAFLFAAMVARGDDMRFFEDDALSFEHQRDAQSAPKTAPAQPPAVQPAVPTPPPPASSSRPPPQALGSVLRLTPQQTLGQGVKVGGVETPKPPTITGQAQPPAATSRPNGTPNSVGLIGGALHVEILSIRELNKDERAATKGKLRCDDPLAAMVRPDTSTKTVLAQAAGVAPSTLPAEFAWMFGRDRQCFDRTGGPLARMLDALDEAARRRAPPAGAK